jgi:FkbM family methyltransferase
MDETWLEEFRDEILGMDRRGVAYDLGANVGEWTRWLAPHFSHVLAVEPDPRAYAALMTDASANVHAVHGAAARVNGATSLHMRASPLQSSISEPHPLGDEETVQTIGVNCYTLDFLNFMSGQAFGTRDVDFIKIDVEGAEADVLAGATLPIFRQCAWLIEVHDMDRDVGRELERLGYSDVKIIKHPHKDSHPGHFWVYVPEASDE